jgi:hypothetical protein
VSIFRLNLFDWWTCDNLASVTLAYLAESGMAKEDAFDEEQELPQTAMKTVRINGGPWPQ